jgi:maleate isomerase
LSGSQAHQQRSTIVAITDLFSEIVGLKPLILIPINGATIWHALRAHGINDKFYRRGWLLEHF